VVEATATNAAGSAQNLERKAQPLTKEDEELIP
jgi:hypothetical protein